MSRPRIDLRSGKGLDACSHEGSALSAAAILQSRFNLMEETLSLRRSFSLFSGQAIAWDADYGCSRPSPLVSSLSAC